MKDVFKGNVAAFLNMSKLWEQKERSLDLVEVIGQNMKRNVLEQKQIEL